MEVKFPSQEDPFRKTMAKAVAGCILALAIGLFLGNALSTLFGTDRSVLNTSNYTDRMAAVRTMFTDADQLDSYSRTALTFQDMDGLKLYTSRNQDRVLALWNGEYVDAYTLFDEEIRLSLVEMMNTADALYGVETTAGEQIDNIMLRNVAVSGGVVYYYLYYDDAGFIGLAFDSTHETLIEQEDIALPLTKTSESGGNYEWFILYSLED